MELLTLNLGATRVMRDLEASKPDELWVASGRRASDETDVSLYLRVGPPRQMAAELVCAVIGRALGLAVPEPFIVRIPAGALPGSQLTKASPQDTLAVGTKHLGGGSFDQLLNKRAAMATKLLLQWPDLMAVTAFDGWLANIDRNLGNFVYARRRLWLIDHAEAIGGPMLDKFDYADLVDAPLTNKITLILNEFFDAGERLGLLDAAAQWLRFPAAALSVAEAMDSIPLHHWHSDAERNNLLAFVRERFTHTHTFLCQQLGHPQLALPKPLQRNTPASAGGAASLSSPPT